MPRHRFPSPAANQGFTLVELLVALAIGSLVALAGVAASVQNIRTTTRMLTAQELRNNWSRLVLLINTDLNEACEVTAGANSLTLRVINPTDFDGNINPSCATATQIVYDLNGTNLRRTGPPVNRNGTLNFGGDATTPQILASGVSAFGTSTNNSFEPRYTLTLTRNGVTYSGDATETVGGRRRVRSFDP